MARDVIRILLHPWKKGSRMRNSALGSNLAFSRTLNSESKQLHPYMLCSCQLQNQEHWQKLREISILVGSLYGRRREYLSLQQNKLWKILKEMGIPDHLTCLLKNLYAGKAATVRTIHRTMDKFKTGQSVHQSYILPPCLFNL